MKNRTIFFLNFRISAFLAVLRDFILLFLDCISVIYTRFENVPKNAIVVEKYDSVTHAALPGCTFQLRYLAGTSGTGGTVIGQKVTGANGIVTPVYKENGEPMRDILLKLILAELGPA